MDHSIITDIQVSQVQHEHDICLICDHIISQRHALINTNGYDSTKN
jgi:hypothetical protein